MVVFFDLPLPLFVPFIQPPGNLRGAGFSRHIDALDFSRLACAAGVIDHAPHSATDDFDIALFQAQLKKIGPKTWLDRNDEIIVFVADIIEGVVHHTGYESRVIALAAIRDRRCDHRHLKRRDFDFSLADGSVRELSAGIHFGQKSFGGKVPRPRKHPGIFPIERESRPNTQAECRSDGFNLRESVFGAGSDGIAHLVKIRVARLHDAGGHIHRSVGAGASHQLSSVRHSPAARPLLIRRNPAAETGERCDLLVCRTRGVALCTTGRQGIRVIQLQLLKLLHEGIRIIVRHAGHRENVAVIWIHDDSRRTTDAGLPECFFRAHLDAGVDGQIHVISGSRFDSSDLGSSLPFRSAFQYSLSSGSPQQFVAVLFDPVMPDDIGLVVVKSRDFFALVVHREKVVLTVFILGISYVAKHVAGERTVEIAADRTDTDLHARKADIIFTNPCHGIESDIREIRIRNVLPREIVGLNPFLRVIEFYAVLRKPESFQFWSDLFIDDAYDICDLHLFRHLVASHFHVARREFLKDLLKLFFSKVSALIVQLIKLRTVTLFQRVLHHLYHFRQVEIDAVTRLVFHKGPAVAVANIAANARDAHGDFAAGLDFFPPLVRTDHLLLPQLCRKHAEPGEHDKCKEVNPERSAR